VAEFEQPTRHTYSLLIGERLHVWIVYPVADLPACVNGVVVASTTKPNRCRTGRLSGEASTCR
jgi:hypothetical protein